MKALVTGGAGFIGSHLAETLLREGHEVRAVDDLSTGNMQNVHILKQHQLFDFVQGSVTDEVLMQGLVADADVVFHLAAAVGVKLAVEHPVETIEANLVGASVVLRQASKAGKRALMTSTSEVYGEGLQVPFQESSDCLQPGMNSRWSYAWSKATAEALAMAYSHQYGLEVILVRLFNTVGPRQTGRYGMVLPRFVQQALAGEPITVHGDGQQSRCFAYVSDVVGGMMQLIEHPQAPGQVFNLGHDREITIEGLAVLIKQITNSSSELTYVPYNQAYGDGFEDMKRRVPDLGKIRALIEYRPTKSLEGIISSVIEHQLAAVGDGDG